MNRAIIFLLVTFSLASLLLFSGCTRVALCYGGEYYEKGEAISIPKEKNKEGFYVVPTETMHTIIKGTSTWTRLF